MGSKRTLVADDERQAADRSGRSGVGRSDVRLADQDAIGKHRRCKGWDETL